MTREAPAPGGPADLGRGRAITLALALGALSACAPNRGATYDRSLAEARRAIHDGRFDAAAAKFDAAARNAKVPRDAVFMHYEAALAWGRAGDVARAASELHAIATAEPPNAYSGQAAFKAAELARANDEAAGLRALEGVVVDFPDIGVAQVALGTLLKHDDEAGPEAALAHLDRIAPRVKGKWVEEKVSYERARRLAALGQTEAARDVFLEVARKWPYPLGSYNDDSLFRAAEMEEKLGRQREAIVHLERLLSQREVASFMGSYERPRYLQAILKIAQIYEKTGERAKARAALHRVYADFTTSTVRDDALWREAALWRKDGDASMACECLSTLASDFPDSRYVPCAALQCPAIKRNAKSKAPATCHAYLLREEGVKLDGD
jgi:tetratricopeptide (TPR) repeat protein